MEKQGTVSLWRRVQRENFTKTEDLLTFLEFSDENKKKVLYSSRFPLNLPRRLAEKMEKDSVEDPLFRQFVPLVEELFSAPGFIADPVQDKDFRKTKKILHKYKGRALLLATSACAMHCRFCFRQNFPYEREAGDFQEEIAYITADPTLSEIILSGGDPLSLNDAVLSSLFQKLESIPHLKRIRFHTRFLVGIPERIDDPFLALLTASSKQIFMVTHCNHPKELDGDVVAALQRLKRGGITLLNHSVLLKGVNDDLETLLALSEGLVNAGVLPYYLNLLDPVEGASHHQVSQEKGIELIGHLRERMSGYGVPRLIREVPGHPSKLFINT